MKTLMIATLCFGLPMAATADEVRLTNGNTLLGVTREEPGRVIVEMNFGTVSIPRAEVRAIVPGRTLLQEYEERALALGTCPDAASTFELALWARDHRLSRVVDDLLRRTIALDADHPQARNLLGYGMHQGKWLKEIELKKALGWVEFRGRWVAPKEPNDFCISEPLCYGVVLAGRRGNAPRRKPAPPEGVSYSLGLPAYSTIGTRNYGSGGYSIWGGVAPTNNLLNLPTTRTRAR